MDEAASLISSGVAPPSAVGRGMFMNRGVHEEEEEEEDVVVDDDDAE
jgi:hypothetical protein